MEGGYQCFGEGVYPEDGGSRYNLSGVTAHMIIIYIYLSPR